MNEKLKTCSRCNEEKEIDFFPKHRTLCKSCWSIYRKEFKAKNKNKIKAYMNEYRQRPESKEKKRKLDKIYYENNKEKVSIKNKDWYLSNRNRMLEYKKNWYLSNKPKCKENSIKWAKSNSEKIREYKRLYDKHNSDKSCAKTQKRNAAKLRATPLWANDFFIKEAYHLAKIRTEITGFNWHVDHLVPLRNKLVCGLHCEYNLQVIPASENISKSNKYWPNMPEEK